MTNLLACRTLVASGYQNRGWPLSVALSCYFLSAESSKLSSFRLKGTFCIWHLTDASLVKFKLIEKWIYLFYFVFNIVIYKRSEFLAVHYLIWRLNFINFFFYVLHTYEVFNHWWGGVYFQNTIASWSVKLSLENFYAHLRSLFNSCLRNNSFRCILFTRRIHQKNSLTQSSLIYPRNFSSKEICMTNKGV